MLIDHFSGLLKVDRRLKKFKNLIKLIVIINKKRIIIPNAAQPPKKTPAPIRH